MQSLNLNKIIDEFAGSPYLTAQKQAFPLIEFQVELARQAASMIGSKPNLLELINHLVANAYSFITESGVIRLSTEFMKVNEPVPGFEIIEAGEYVVLKIGNTGRELKEEEINRLFEPFAGKWEVTSAQQGRGLGMAVAYAIIKGHKGMIDVKSFREKGTEVIIYFPAHIGPAEIIVQPAGVNVQGIETILVVDDDSELRKTTMGSLRSIGYRVIGARNGSEAVELVRKAAQEQDQAIDLIVLDMIMADNFDGLDTYQAILQINPHQKAIITSGFTITDRIKSAMQLGVGQCLLKPCEHDDLARAVRKELDKPPREV
jgi:CheY-like chemotaxis protein